MLNCSTITSDRTWGRCIVCIIEVITYAIYDHLGLDHTSAIWNKEVSLIQRLSKYTFLWLTVRPSISVHIVEAGVLSSEGCNREVPLYYGVCMHMCLCLTSSNQRTDSLLMSVRIQNVNEEVYADNVFQDFPVVIYFTALNQVQCTCQFLHDVCAFGGYWAACNVEYWLWAEATY